MADVKKYHNSISTTNHKMIVDIIAEYPGCSTEKKYISRKTRLIEDLGYDNLGDVDTILKLEEAFEISIPDEDADKVLETVGTAIDYVEKALTEKAKQITD